MYWSFSGMNMGLVLDAVMKGLNGKLELAEANDLIEAAKDWNDCYEWNDKRR